MFELTSGWLVFQQFGEVGGVGVAHCCVLVFCFVFLVDVLLRL